MGAIPAFEGCVLLQNIIFSFYLNAENLLVSLPETSNRYRPCCPAVYSRLP